MCYHSGGTRNDHTIPGGGVRTKRKSKTGSLNGEMPRQPSFLNGSGGTPSSFFLSRWAVVSFSVGDDMVVAMSGGGSASYGTSSSVVVSSIR